MTDQTRKSISYAFDFMTFLLLEKGVENKIASAYIFGSAVRNELDKESDIDIFINCEESDEEFILKAAEAARKKFVVSKDFDKWKAFNFTHKISIKAGPIGEWELRESIESEGIEIFSKNVKQENMERVVIFLFELPKDKKYYLKIKRELFGRVEKAYRSDGIITKYGGKQIGSSIFIVPKSAQSNLIKIMHDKKIRFSMMEFLRKID